MAAQGPFATALSHAERLPPRERTLLTLASAVAHFRLNTELDPLFEYVARYPDDPDGWYFLGEAGLHVSGGTGITDAMLEEALYRAVELAPTFLPYYLHALQWAAAKGQEERFEALLAEATEQGFTEEALGHPGLQWDLLHGDETQRETAAARVAALPPPDVLRWGPGLLPLVDEGLDRLASLDPVMDALNPNLESLQQSRWRWEGRYDDYRASYAADTTLLGRTLVAEMTLAQFRTGDATRSEARAVCDVLGEGSEGGGRNPHHARTECAILFGDDDDVRRHADASLRASGLVLDGFPPFLDTLGLRGSLMAYYEARQMADLGDPEAGYLHLEVALEHTIWLFETPPQLGFLAFEAERWDDAIRILEGSSRNPVFRSPAKFRLGQAYEAVGERERALDAYRTYLARMANADPGLQSVRTAREAVVRLER
jgi:tetratricopeptide (TPR) repeat protein